MKKREVAKQPRGEGGAVTFTPKGEKRVQDVFYERELECVPALRTSQLACAC
jgi:hypothetical protein